MSDYHKIQKLKGTKNYKPQEIAIRVLLVVNGVFKVIRPEYKPLTNPDLPTTGGAKLPIEEVDEDKWEKHVDLEERALAAIHITISPSAYSMIKTLKTVKEAWAKLKSLYGTDSYATKKTTYFALYKLRSDQFKDLYAYLAKFEEYTNKLL